MIIVEIYQTHRLTQSVDKEECDDREHRDQEIPHCLMTLEDVLPDVEWIVAIVGQQVGMDVTGGKRAECGYSEVLISGLHCTLS